MSEIYSLPELREDKCNCSNFSTQAYAQWFHDKYDPSDVNRLDQNHDGVVCESNP